MKPNYREQTFRPPVRIIDIPSDFDVGQRVRYGDVVGVICRIRGHFSMGKEVASADLEVEIVPEEGLAFWVQEGRVSHA